MREVVGFPDAEALVIAFLKAELAERGDAATVRARVPSPKIGRAVRVSRTGGSRINVGQDAPQITVECWDATDVAALNLAALTRGLVGSMEEYGSEIGGVVYFPDAATTLPRYQFTAQLYTAGVPL